MSIRTLMVGLLALVCGVSAAVGVNRLRGNTVGPARQNLDIALVPVAAIEIRRGEQITEEMLTEREWPKDMVPDGILLDKSEIVGKTVGTSLYKDEPILAGKIGIDRLPVKDGMRAYTILTPNDASLVAGFIEPGDHVDVLFTDERSNKEYTGGGSTTPLLQNIEVLAVGKVVDPQESRERDARDMRSITLSVSLDMAAKLALAQELGTLHLALRPNSDESTASAETITMNELWRTMYPAFFSEKEEEAVPEPEPVVVPVSAEEVEQPKEILIRTSRGVASGRLVIRTTSENRRAYLSAE